MTMTGEFIKISLDNEAQYKIEWTIKDIFSPRKEYEDYDSPCFTVPGSKWFLKMCMQGCIESGAKSNSYRWISIYLCPAMDQKYPISTNYILGVKKADATLKEIIVDSYEFNNADAIGYKMLERSELLQKKSELAPSDALTVVCLLRAKDSFDSTSRLIKLSEHFEDLFASKKFCDVTLKVQHVEFSAHKCVLATRSTVFAAMFEADMKERNTGIVDIEDCDSGAFKDLLYYLYSGKSRIFPYNVFNLYRIAHKYDVEELKSDCVLFILNNLSSENLYDAVILADQFDEEGVKIKIRVFFIENFAEIVHTAKWELFLKDNWRLTNELLKSVALDMKSKGICKNCREDSTS